MNLAFIIPQEKNRQGGIDTAIFGLKDALENKGQAVLINPPLQELRALPSPTVLNFHGIWEPRHAPYYQLCQKHALPYTISPHGMLEPWAWQSKWLKKQLYFTLIEKKFLANANALLTTSEMEKQNLHKRTQHKNIQVLPLGADQARTPRYQEARKELKWNSDERILLYLSRIDRKKGLDLLISALAQIGKQASAFRTRLVIVGDGEKKFQTKVKNLAQNLAPRLPSIDWVGSVWGEERWKYFEGANLFCLPTHSENFGIAVLEAMQAGTPILTTENTPWVTLRGRPGIHITKTQISSLANELHRFLNAPPWSPEDRSERSQWANENYQWPTLVDHYLAFYKKIAA